MQNFSAIKWIDGSDSSIVLLIILIIANYHMKFMVRLFLFGRVEVINDFKRVELIFDLIELTEFL